MASIIERGGKFQARVRVTGFPSQSKTCDSKTEAKEWLSVIKSEMVRGVFVDRSEAESTTLGEALRRYGDEVTPSKKGRLQEKYRIAFLLENELCRRSLASLRSLDFARYRDKRLKVVSPSTVVKDLALFSHLFSVAIKEWGIGVTNPLLNVRKPKVRNSRTRRFEGDEESRLMAELAQCGNVYMLPVAQFAIETAMRQGEILGLKRADIFPNFVRLLDTKNEDDRDVPLSSRAREILSSLPVRSDGRVFGLNQQALIQAWVRACRRAGIKDLRFHDLRREAASRISERLQMHELARVTGHKDTRMLLRYYNPRIEDLAKKLG